MLKGMNYVLLLFIIGFGLYFSILWIFQRFGWLGENYRGDFIPLGTGVLLWVLNVIGNVIFASPETLYDSVVSPGSLLAYSLALTIVFMAGWIDDRFGNHRVKGLKGHFMAFAKMGQITSGLLKAMMISAAALWAASHMSTTLAWGVVYFFILTLSANAVNLLDLRPGRACKVFLVGATLIILLGATQLALSFLLPLIIGALIVLPSDLGARTMLGDSGANVLGFALGWTAIFAAPNWFLLIILTKLLVLHFVAEHRSITVIVENNRLLHWFDQLGRV